MNVHFQTAKMKILKYRKTKKTKSNMNKVHIKTLIHKGSNQFRNSLTYYLIIYKTIKIL